MRKWIGNLGLVVIGCVVGFLLLELGLRVLGISYPYFYIPDDLLGYRLKPGAEGLWNKEGKAYITINQAGWRDREHHVDKPVGTFRIAVLGDSYTEALQVPIEETFWARLEQELPGCPALSGRTVEVMNFGVGGYSPAQEFLVLRHKVSPYDPDLVVQALFTGNDITGSIKELDANNLRPYFLIEEGHLIVDNSFRRSRAFWFQQLPFSSEAFEVSRVLQVLREGKYKFQAYLADLEHQQRTNGQRDHDVTLQTGVYLDPTDSLWRNAWTIVEKSVMLIKREAEDEGSRFLLAILSNSDQVHPDLQHRRSLAQQLGIQDLFYPDRRIQTLAERENIELLSLAEPFADYAEQHGTFLHGFSNAQLGKGHWNATGHRLAGDRIAEKICQMMNSEFFPVTRDSSQKALHGS